MLLKTISISYLLFFSLNICISTYAQTPPMEAPSPITGNQLNKNTESKTTSLDNSIESFFQIDSSKNSNSNSKTKQTPSPVHYLYKGIWHILDNAGVPMFFGKDQNLDPSIGKVNIIPPPAFPSKANLRKNTTNSANPIIIPAQQKDNMQAPQKIPTNELEGTIYEPKTSHDEQTP